MAHNISFVEQTTEINGALSVSYGPMISGSGAGSYLDSKVNSKRQISIIYRTRRVAYAKGVDPATIKPIVGLDKLSSDDMYEMYGSKFIESMLYGAQLDVIFTIESSEDTDLTDIAAELKGRIGVGPLSVSFQAKFEKQEGESRSRYTLSIKARASGIDFGVGSNPSFEEVNTLIEDFNTKYTETLEKVSKGETVDSSNVASGFSPIAFSLSPISRYLPSKLSVDESSRFDDKMEDLSSSLHDAMFLKVRKSFLLLLPKLLPNSLGSLVILRCG